MISQVDPREIESLLFGLDSNDFDDDLQDGSSNHHPSSPPPSQPFGEDLSSVELPAFTGFANARGVKLPPPSEEALRQAMTLVASASQDPEEGPASKRQKLDEAGPPTSLFKTGNGHSLPAPSDDAFAKVSALFDSAQDAEQPESGPCKPLVPTPPTSLFSTSNGKAIPPPSEAARRLAATFFDETSQNDAPPTRASQACSTPPISITPFRPPVSVGRTPLRSTLGNSAGPSTPAAMDITRQKAVDIRTPVTQRRLGMSSTSSPVSGSRRKGFVTPFKIPQSKLASGIRAPVATPPAQAVSVVHRSVFDLTASDSRSTLREAFLKPQYYTDSDYEEHKIPEHVLRLTLENASNYSFLKNGILVPFDTVIDDLRRDGCGLVSRAWASNHWGQILWKLAGECQAQPSLFPNLWTLDEVIRQLKYRYEREFGHAQRSLVRRIRENDTPPSVPMVLCVSKVRRMVVPASKDSKQPEQQVILELTDGWYRINAQIDSALKRAVDRGRVCVGRKLAICGVKLAPGAEGEDPLEISNMCCLMLTANSCSLSRWDTRLGRQRDPFVSSLCSISVDGGTIALVDVKLDKLFPKAYMSAQKGQNEAPWDEAEESRRVSAWKDRRETETVRLTSEADDEVAKSEQILEALVSCAEQSKIGTGESLDEDDLFDSITHAGNPLRKIQTLSSKMASRLIQRARSHCSAAVESRSYHVQHEIERLCPARDTRSFRVARVTDAQIGDREPGRRVAMVNIWDCDQLPPDILKAGGRYLISNLAPGRAGDWAVPHPNDTTTREIYLHTRRDTRWYPGDSV
ncbi:BRCA2, oligonucleotide/oligosaccharide-binding, domain 1-domain-containing protein [Kockovaella imperatae]|uniref:BRCA2, oligonucleotide/oligosaccharide-binding, domain 1-domain-containing protein n=1 Tax=Kockovaella imperatae TaxID=4999 RepID=A0A1Y1UI61_9TREE|nr:BRCA2, oligonucleotide/oligosaccharide-binding, domain 1-domain-containing protein [Kockovaella imperatae]ORX37738.1 BRCA2, oligonucleotide/oligosaccharide-binding, domain 1-domain-containing protein [Kockovaella imperatae]